MENKYTLFASILENPFDCNSCIRYEALDIEYKTIFVQIIANEKDEAIRIFQDSKIYREFCERQNIRHIEHVHTFIKGESDSDFHRAG